MKKIFILLSFFTIFTFTIFNNSKASATYIADEFGTNMTYKTLFLYDTANPDFEFNNWWDASLTTFAFEYIPVETSLEELIRAWDDSSSFFMKVYTNVITLEYLTSTNSIPTGNLGWTTEDGYLYIIIDKDYLRDSFPEYYDNPNIPTEQATLLAMADLAEVIKVDTWVITESTPDYQTGYNAGYQSGFGAGFSAGWDAKEYEFNLQLPALLLQEYQNGYDTGYNVGYDEGLQITQGEAYDRGYQDGANESFIASIENWLVPAIIVVMLLGGFFAITRKKRDGDI